MTRETSGRLQSSELRQALIGHVATSVHELQEKIRAARSDEITDRDGLDDADSSELDIHDIAVALMQLKTEILKQ